MVFAELVAVASMSQGAERPVEPSIVRCFPSKSADAAHISSLNVMQAEQLN